MDETEPKKPFWPTREDYIRAAWSFAYVGAAIFAFLRVEPRLESWGVTNGVARLLMIVAAVWLPFALIDKFVVGPLTRREP